MTRWQDRFKLVPAVYVLFRRGSEVLLSQRANTGYFDGFYSLPAGHVDGGEPATAAACREALEEVGVVIKPADLKLLHTVHRLAEEANYERIDLFFEVAIWQGEIRNNEPEKCSELRWAKLQELPPDMVPVVRQALDNIQQGVPYSEAGFAVSAPKRSPAARLHDAK